MRRCQEARSVSRMNEDWLAVIVGLSLVGLVVLRVIGPVSW